MMISVAFSVFIYLDMVAMVSVSEEPIFINAIITEAPNNSKTMDTVVEVGKPIVLKKSRRRISVIITAMKIIMISSK